MKVIAVPLLIAFLASLVFIGWLISRRSARRRDANAKVLHQLDEAEALIHKIDVHVIGMRDIDPTAELIYTLIRTHDSTHKEIA